MTDIRLPSSGNIQVRWHPDNAFATPGKFAPTEVNAGLNITDSISWNDFGFGVQGSQTTNDPSLKAKSNVADRGAMQYGGGISIYIPKDYEDMSNDHAVTYAALSVPRTRGWISIQVDGELSETNTPLYSGGLTQTAATGDLIDVFRVMTAAYSHSITGEEAFRETINFLPQGEAFVNAVVAAAPTVVVAPATASVTAGSIEVLSATVSGRKFTNGVRWTSSDTALATVSQNGIVTAKAAGSVTVTATYQGATASSVITIS